MDTKKSLLQTDWASSADEQQLFGCQSPYASSASAASYPPRDNSNDQDAVVSVVPRGQPTATPGMPFQIPVDAPPMYTEDPFPKTTESSTPRHPQVQPSQPLQQQQPYQQPCQQPSAQYVPQDHAPYHTPPPPTPTAPLPRQQQQQQHPQYQQPLLAPQQQQVYYQPTVGGPANYGTTANPATAPVASYPQNYPGPQNRRHKREGASVNEEAKGEGEQYSDGVYCWVPENSQSRSDTQVFAALPDLAFKFKTLDGITGNVLVKESESFSEANIRVNILMRASSTELLDQLEQTLIQDNVRRTAYSTVHIKDRNDKETKKKLMRRNCARADVQIVYPRGHPALGKLDIVVANGELILNMNQDKTLWGVGHGLLQDKLDNATMTAVAAGSFNQVKTSFEELRLVLTNGEINVDGLVVASKTQLGVVNGRIFGNLQSAGKVAAEIINGNVDFTIDSSLSPALNSQYPNWNADNLQININAVNARIDVNLVQRFLGYFSLSNTIGQSAIEVLNNERNRDQIEYTTKRGYEVKGWISERGQEPDIATSRMTMTTVNGNIRVNVNTQGN
ncbi:hypothetical protein EDD11_009775 [Mortierella claussenii]|nr:hypothetical protein EDD11_009775 [Mortierella claussenii]